MATAAVAPSPLAASVGASAPVRPGGAAADGNWDFSFHDLVSVVNPLQHFPIVSTLYRKLTGDTIKPLERVAGDTLFGGWVGFVSSVANVIFENETGKDFGDTVLAFLNGDDAKPAFPDATAVATNAPASTSALQPVPVSQSALAPFEPALTVVPSPSPQPVIDTFSQATLVPAVSDQTGAAAALVASLANSHVDFDLSQRALYAYRRTIQATQAPLALAPAH